MANAKKLPSGAWRTRITKVVNGKKVTRSFTVHPKECQGNSRKAKDQSEKLAREWRLATEDDYTYGKTVQQALNDYINDRKKVLSPSTITNYWRLLPYFDSIMDICVTDIKTSDIQPLINEMSLSVKRKTIQNRISFLLSALDYADCDKRFKLRYPPATSKVILSPDLEDVQMLIDAAPEDFKPILYLAAFGGLRRGEIVALKQKDISRDMNTVFVHADIVLDGNKWVYKPLTKNDTSGVIGLSKEIISALPYSEDPEAYLFDLNPNMVSHRYDKLTKKLGFNYNFHSLRHFAASFRSDIGIPSKYIEEGLRWKSSRMLKEVYDNPLESSRKKYTQMANRYIEENFFKAISNG